MKGEAGYCLLDHSKVETTARSACLTQESERDSAIRVFDSIEASVLVNGKVVEADFTQRPDGMAGSCFLPYCRTPFVFRRTLSTRAESRMSIKRDFRPVFRVIPVEGRVMDARRRTARAMS